LALAVGFGLRASVALYYTFVAIDADLLWDGYYEVAMALANQGLRETIGGLGAGAYGYSALIALVYQAVGESSFLIRALGVFASTLTILVVWKACSLLWSTRTASNAAIIVALFPNLIRFSGIYASREALIILLI